MCKFCKNNTMIDTLTTHVVNYKNYVIIVKNVPCVECLQCGEKYYSNEVTILLDRIINDAKKYMQDVSIIDYKKVA